MATVCMICGNLMDSKPLKKGTSKEGVDNDFFCLGCYRDGVFANTDLASFEKACLLEIRGFLEPILSINILNGPIALSTDELSGWGVYEGFGTYVSMIAEEDLTGSMIADFRIFQTAPGICGYSCSVLLEGVTVGWSCGSGLGFPRPRQSVRIEW